MSALISEGIEALYLHVPFCASRCNYCGFSTRAVPEDGGILAIYASSLAKAVKTAAKAGFLDSVKTVYIGGGTPSFLGVESLAHIAHAVRESVPSDIEEFTVEANPDSFSPQLVDALADFGVNRFSLGIQSFDARELARLGRIHDATQAQCALEELASRGFNFSGDLICGIDGQDMDSWKRSLQHMIALGAPHVSIYPLSIEEGTPLAARIASGRMAAPDEDFEASCMEAASDVLGAAGLSRYEVASYALPGHQSKHNTAYWSGKQYLGIGAAAASMVTPDVFQALIDAGIIEVPEDVMQQAERPYASGKAGIVRFSCEPGDAGFIKDTPRAASVEHLDLCETACEQAMLRMRMTRGILASELSEAETAAPGISQVFEGAEDDGLVEKTNGGYVPTERGWLLGNVLYGRIWDFSERSASAR